jgi:hypothetical protein
LFRHVLLALARWPGLWHHREDSALAGALGLEQRMNELHTVFDITVDSNGIGGDAWIRMGFGIAATIASMVWLVRVWRRQSGWRQMLNAACLIGLGAIWLIVTLPLWNLVSDSDRLRLIQLRGQSEVTEDAVHVTHMQPLHGHASGDRIVVDGRQFEIDYFRLTPGYRQTIAHGGALREGVYARLHHYGGVITKVEVRP